MIRRVLLAVLLVAAAPAYALDMPRPNDFEAIGDRLGLSDDQRAKVSDIVYDYQTRQVDLRAKVDKAEIELARVLDAEKPDDKAVLKAVDALIAAEADVKRNKVLMMLEIRKVLTPEQWRQLEEIRRHRRGRDETPPPPL